MLVSCLLLLTLLHSGRDETRLQDVSTIHIFAVTSAPACWLRCGTRRAHALQCSQLCAGIHSNAVLLGLLLYFQSAISFRCFFGPLLNTVYACASLHPHIHAPQLMHSCMFTQAQLSACSKHMSIPI